MAMLSKPSTAAYTSLIYITLGALTVVWTGVWYAWLRAHPPVTDAPYFWCAGFGVTGVTLLVIGLALGRIGRAARHAELPPPEVTRTEANVQQTAAQAPVVVPGTTPVQTVPTATVVPGTTPAQPAAPLNGGPNAPRATPPVTR
jgi:hypothetical protein